MNIGGKGFSGLTPEVIVGAAESALGRRLAGLTIPFPSYINRVYELVCVDGERVVAKFYRPGRWSREALQEEHAFMAECVLADIPLAAPLVLADGSTLGETDGGIYFALFPKKAGRRFEPLCDEDWVRLGMLAARIHNAGSGITAVERPHLTPDIATMGALNRLEQLPFIATTVKENLRWLVERIVDAAAAEFTSVELITVHGDLHGGNILYRPGDGLSVIDFDDMAVAPAAQDLWLLLPGCATDCVHELDLLLEGYRKFREIDDISWRMLESLRAMRMVYYLDWCARQKGDFMFERNYPDWGSVNFWRTELAALEEQLMLLESGNSAGVVAGHPADDYDKEEENWLY